MKANSKGFTLVEMLVVLAIIGISSGVIWGGMYNIRRTSFNHFTTQVVDLVELAQQKASLTNCIYSIHVGRTDGTSVIQMKNQGTIQEQLPIPRGVTARISTSNGQIVFEKDMSPSKAATIYLEDTSMKEKRRLTLRVATGKITLYHD